WNATHSQVEHHLGGQAEVIPCRGVVARPGETIALPARVSGAGENERALLGTQGSQTFECGTRVLESDDIVNFGMGCASGYETGLFDAMNGIQGHGLAGAVEYRGLVHVIPESGGAVLHKLLIEASPPLAGLCPREIRKDRRARPYDADEFAAVEIF